MLLMHKALECRISRRQSLLYCVNNFKMAACCGQSIDSLHPEPGPTLGLFTLRPVVVVTDGGECRDGHEQNREELRGRDRSWQKEGLCSEPIWPIFNNLFKLTRTIEKIHRGLSLFRNLLQSPPRCLPQLEGCCLPVMVIPTHLQSEGAK